MNVEELKLNISEALKNLEASGEIMITTSTPNTVVDTLLETLGKDIESLLNENEFYAVLNCLSSLADGRRLDDWDFQTITGIERDDLKLVLNRLYKDR